MNTDQPKYNLALSLPWHNPRPLSAPITDYPVTSEVVKRKSNPGGGCDAVHCETCTYCPTCDLSWDLEAYKPGECPNFDTSPEPLWRRFLFWMGF